MQEARPDANPQSQSPIPNPQSPDLCGVQDLVDRQDQAVELAALGGEPFSAGGGQRVVARAAIVFGGGPVGLRPSPEEEALQRRVERALAHLQHVVREELQPLRDAVAVLRAARERLQDQQVERARQQLDGSGAPHVCRWESARARQRCQRAASRPQTRRLRRDPRLADSVPAAARGARRLSMRTDPPGRRDFLKTMVAVGAAGLPLAAARRASAAAISYDPAARFELTANDDEFRRNAAGRLLMARVYRPAGAGPFPTVLDLHGGAWHAEDRQAEE